MKLLLIISILATPLMAQLPASCQQVIVGISDGWHSTSANLHLYEKRGGQWHLVRGPWPAKLGKSGLAWGRGVHTTPDGAKLKVEGDRRSPAGIFALGGAFGYDPDIQRNPRLSYRKITTRDLFVEDSTSKYYNRHLVLDREPTTDWEKKAQMRQNDEAHSLKLFIEHNTHPRIVPNGGSSIFFHVWRGGGSRATFGCTTMAKPQLRAMIAALDPAKNPHYVLLPHAEYMRLRQPWRLP